MSPADEPGHDTSTGGYAGTRTRLPETDSTRRPARSSSRSLVTVVAVVVLLIAAIAFANRGNGDGGGSGTTADGASGTKPQAQSTAATGTKPVDSKTGSIPTGYAQTRQGVQSAAANYAVALGSTAMFKKATRDDVVGTVYTSAEAARLVPELDKAYSTDFLARAGLDANGDAPQGSTFVSRTVPIGTTVSAYADTTATVAVWSMGLIGMSGTNSTDPVSSSWSTWTFTFRWTDGDWKVASQNQTSGPAPVPGDNKAASSDEISKAIEEYGGFTYAR
ncbi:hypothetical protein [Streptomyces acidiscabies]|uniref:DUF8175 domain-containing protein n=1 Tax=Streptomyces acidiscabies TaxID=42234 RepID=A0AAP6BJ85_9ACTN|nr:hypothetical protein [Streptomyces acidiscabies]MBP5938641.1 hypothetical protein [Streptomyces sp. LBUM 1476]MBZ3909742.1 hypothetical protein [Streptomyces acidiscabies]MDX2965771.1 hypothetical protein [Streptomyces acidiscabies]MDX3025267.1 hypothetical protein [Streptomyces acidiscabies]MDX3795607.1 hypothetical protein [Streptomyces acidiscabies]